MNTAPKLAITALSKTFGSGRSQTVALRDISLTLADNEFVSLVGTSGCGKSTILSIVAGLQDYDEGTVLVDGAPIKGPGLDRGVVFQSYTLLPWLTARQNVEFALKAAGYKKNASRDLADEHLKLVNLEKFAEAYPSQLSGGMKQRVAIARALSYRPKMLLMDEPFGALDALTRHQMQQLLTRIWEEHRLTVLFVTHDVEEAVYISDRIVVMGMSPGYIKQSFPVALPRPRHQRMIGSDEFVAIQRDVMAAIRGVAD
ncbi:MAG TPA: ABC transporter ATP-binding protein [Acidisoma sp.]|uniref:ABC transporter ATP-binding protein n=1 Tax=Acidisoma sp. TaxID=1872115 RepID=UPI002BB41C7B|nr:ABC transporter ATP-binding protein [Acidisoma sp.]HTI01348.1 ABC transporter ATP-binding protein [Acidisoma sp.]